MGDGALYRLLCQIGIVYGVRPRRGTICVLCVAWLIRACYDIDTWGGQNYVVRIHTAVVPLCVFLWKRCREIVKARRLAVQHHGIVVCELGVVAAREGWFRYWEATLGCLTCVVSVI